MEQNLKQRIQLTLLPLTDEILPEKRARDSRGQAHFIINNRPLCRVCALSLEAGAGTRGNHYHKLKTEGFYLLSGIMELKLKCLTTKQSATLVLEPGSRFFIPPKMAHSMRALQSLWFIEFTDYPYDKNDDHPYSLT